MIIILLEILILWIKQLLTKILTCFQKEIVNQDSSYSSTIHKSWTPQALISERLYFTLQLKTLQMKDLRKLKLVIRKFKFNWDKFFFKISILQIKFLLPQAGKNSDKLRCRENIWSNILKKDLQKFMLKS